ncbi:Serine/threonine protein kinase [Nostoc flagelliforme CCNUN1]|uniref:Serine/threonine protein kinase n=1 Tax=Nostoc flagelliforme CCNUN1 TaxID=2038116 RepID=A0A2K8SW34_9NOSO|nr:Serine/threonine protein kinase [Nostoc flagelliforme CCNUN1]
MILKHRLKANEQRPEIEVITDYGNLPQLECFPGQLVFWQMPLMRWMNQIREEVLRKLSPIPTELQLKPPGKMRA